VGTDVLAAEEVAGGVRDELAMAGRLLPGESWPRVEIEVMRSDESSEGAIAAGGEPKARGLGEGIVARAWLSRDPDAERERDTADRRAEVTAAVDTGGGAPDPRWASNHRSSALRAAARQLGRRLARAIEGLPALTDDPLERTIP